MSQFIDAFKKTFIYANPSISLYTLVYYLYIFCAVMTIIEEFLRRFRKRRRGLRPRPRSLTYVRILLGYYWDIVRIFLVYYWYIFL